MNPNKTPQQNPFPQYQIPGYNYQTPAMNNTQQQYPQYMQQYMNYLQYAAGNTSNVNMTNTSMSAQQNLMMINNSYSITPNQSSTAQQIEQIKIELAKPSLDESTRQRLNNMRAALESSKPIPSTPVNNKPRPRPQTMPHPMQQFANPTPKTQPLTSQPIPTANSNINTPLTTASGTKPASKPPSKPATVTIEPSTQPIVTKEKFREILSQIDPQELMDMDTEELLIEICQDFVEKIIKESCKLAHHRQSSTLSVSDAIIPLERQYNIRIAGFGNQGRPIGRVGKSDALKRSHRVKVNEVRKVVVEQSHDKKLKKRKTQVDDKEKEKSDE